MSGEATEPLEIGRIGRAHGIRGDVIVALVSDANDRLAPGSSLQTDRGPLRVVTSRPHTKGWIVHFDGVERREDAEGLRGTVLRAEARPDAEGLWVHQIVGLEVVDTEGVAHGSVVAVQPNPAHDLLVLDDDTLVPSVFIVSVDDHITVDVPEGLFG